VVKVLSKKREFCETS